MKKKVWEKPRLIVLFRGRPEESVLQACKTSLEQGPHASPLMCQIGTNLCASPVGT